MKHLSLMGSRPPLTGWLASWWLVPAEYAWLVLHTFVYMWRWCEWATVFLFSFAFFFSVGRPRDSASMRDYHEMVSRTPQMEDASVTRPAQIIEAQLVFFIGTPVCIWLVGIHFFNLLFILFFLILFSGDSHFFLFFLMTSICAGKWKLDM